MEQSLSFLFFNFFQLEILPSQNETVTQVFLADNLVLGQFFRSSLEEDLSFKQQVSTVSNAQGFLHVMVCNQNTDVLVFQFPDDVLDIFHGNRVYSGKRFVKHDKLGVDSQTAGNFRTAAFTSGKVGLLSSCVLSADGTRQSGFPVSLSGIPVTY